MTVLPAPVSPVSAVPEVRARLLDPQFKDLAAAEVPLEVLDPAGKPLFPSPRLLADKTPREFYTRKVDLNLYAVGEILPLGEIAAGATQGPELWWYLHVRGTLALQRRAERTAEVYLSVLINGRSAAQLQYKLNGLISLVVTLALGGGLGDRQGLGVERITAYARQGRQASLRAVTAFASRVPSAFMTPMSVAGKASGQARARIAISCTVHSPTPGSARKASTTAGSSA